MFLSWDFLNYWTFFLKAFKMMFLSIKHFLAFSNADGALIYFLNSERFMLGLWKPLHLLFCRMNITVKLELGLPARFLFWFLSYWFSKLATERAMMIKQSCFVVAWNFQRRWIVLLNYITSLDTAAWKFSCDSDKTNELQAGSRVHWQGSQPLYVSYDLNILITHSLIYDFSSTLFSNINKIWVSIPSTCFGTRHGVLYINFILGYTKFKKKKRKLWILQEYIVFALLPNSIYSLPNSVGPLRLYVVGELEL